MPGVPLDEVRRALGSLAIEPETVWTERVTRAGISATKFYVRGETGPPWTIDQEHHDHEHAHGHAHASASHRQATHGSIAPARIRDSHRHASATRTDTRQENRTELCRDRR